MTCGRRPPNLLLIPPTCPCIRERLHGSNINGIEQSKYSEGQGGLSISQHAEGPLDGPPGRQQRAIATDKWVDHSLRAGAAGASSAANSSLYAVRDLTPSTGARSLRPAGHRRQGQCTSGLVHAALELPACCPVAQHCTAVAAAEVQPHTR